MDADGKRRLIDIHSWNHMNQWAGYANSLHLYLELLPYVDRTWIGEGFPANNTLDFWLVEMSGIPFGLMSETLDARNVFRGMIYGMLPRLPWSGNPVPLWHLWDDFGMKDAVMRGYWDERCPVKRIMRIFRLPFTSTEIKRLSYWLTGLIFPKRQRYPWTNSYWASSRLPIFCRKSETHNGKVRCLP